MDALCTHLLPVLVSNHLISSCDLLPDLIATPVPKAALLVKFIISFRNWLKALNLSLQA